MLAPSCATFLIRLASRDGRLRELYGRPLDPLPRPEHRVRIPRALYRLHVIDPARDRIDRAPPRRRIGREVSLYESRFANVAQRGAVLRKCRDARCMRLLLRTTGPHA